ncbi:MAG: hypothetical protein N2555_03245 [Endomicrobia bacterium]|nr:hypothetical protein [Endomicrobiia bacterium]
MRTTLIGSVPYVDPEFAVEKTFSCVNIPCWPQLPKRSFKEHMCPQYSESFPGIVVDENQQKIYVDEDVLYSLMEKFYQNYLDKNIDYFVISAQYASGFYKFLNTIKAVRDEVVNLKLQTTGPVTFGLTVKTTQGQPLFYNEHYRDIIVKHLVMKSVWQVKCVKEHLFDPINVNLILFYDEPYLAAYGSAFTAVNKEEIIKCLVNATTEIKIMVKELWQNVNLRVGVHCCANTDWSILTSVDTLDIISFDAYDYFDSFALYKEEIKKFVSRGGEIAWGLVPNNEKIFSFNLSFGTVTDEQFKLLQHIEKFGYEVLLSKIDKQQYVDRLPLYSILSDGIVTPQCGLGNTTEQITDRVLTVCRQISIL